MKIFKRSLKISKKSILIASVLVIALGLPLAYYLWANSQEDGRAWFDSNWIYRKAVQIPNPGSTLLNEDVLISLDTATLISQGKLQSDCGDLRFLDSDDQSSIDYWVEDDCNTSDTKIWIRIPNLPNGGKTIYSYYGNPSATNGTLAWSGNVYMYADTTCPTGWTRASTLDNKFLYGSSTSGTALGSDSHGHSNAICTSTSISTTNVNASSVPSSPTGGSISYSGGYTIHTFTSSGTFSVPENLSAEFLIVGGGGGGGQIGSAGNEACGGGGAGGLLTSNDIGNANIGAGSHTITVGSGGGPNAKGGNSAAFGYTAEGGGYGGFQQAQAGSGGSGGGGRGYASAQWGGAGNPGLPRQGYDGGMGQWGGAVMGGGGGGGAGGGGGIGTDTVGGAGGTGRAISISGSSIYYAGGGGGARDANAGAGGNGGGGAGGTGITSNGGNGTNGRGGGGGGAGRGGGIGGTGGSGIVIIRYPTPTSIAVTPTNHQHSNLQSAVNTNSTVLPPYKNTVLCYNNRFTISQGLISVFDDPVPSGWTRFTELDNYFPRLSSSFGTTGGNSSHTHSPNISGYSTNSASSTVNARNYSPPLGIGGTVTYSGGYTIHTFYNSGTFSLAGNISAEFLIVAGGGGGGQIGLGGNEGCGGGGAGGLLTSNDTGAANLVAGSYTITVGNGASPNAKGANSTAFGYTAEGGGPGGFQQAQAGSGGSGGGGRGFGSTQDGGVGNAGPPRQGYNGGQGVWGGIAGGGGGGGAGGGGGQGNSSVGGAGGTGRAISISGSSIYYAGGGGGARDASAGAGGNGGGGVGATGNVGNGGWGTNGRGGGGGGAGREGGAGGYGGKGIVIVRYPTPNLVITPIASNHTHNINSATVSSDSNVPPYTSVIFGKSNSSVYVTNDNIVMTSSVPPLGWNRFTALDGKLTMGSATYGTTGGVDLHTHNIGLSTTGPMATTQVYGSGIYGADTNHTHSCSTTSSSVSNLPASSSIIYMQRKVSISTTVNTEEVYGTGPIAPTSLTTEGLTNPTNVGDTTPEFSATFNDTDAEDEGTNYEIEVNTSIDFTGTSMWDTGKTVLSPYIDNGTRLPDVSYAGSSLVVGNTYYWRIRFWDTMDFAGTWSDPASFTIVAAIAPEAPTDLKTNSLTNPIKVPLVPSFSAIYNDPDADQ